MDADDNDADNEDSISSYLLHVPSPQVENTLNQPSPSPAGSSNDATPTFKDINQSAFNYFTSKLHQANQDYEIDTDLSLFQNVLPDANLAQIPMFNTMQLSNQILDQNETGTNTSYSSWNTLYEIVPYAQTTQEAVQIIGPLDTHQPNLNYDSTTTIQPNLIFTSSVPPTNFESPVVFEQNSNFIQSPVVFQSYPNSSFVSTAALQPYLNFANLAETQPNLTGISQTTQQNDESPTIPQHFQDSMQDANNQTYLTPLPYSFISPDLSTQYYVIEEPPLPNNDNYIIVIVE